MDLKREQAFVEFVSTYSSLVTTLVDKYGRRFPNIVQESDRWFALTKEARGSYILVWWGTMSAHLEKINSRNTLLFTLDLPQIMALELQALWWTNSLSNVSKDYVWSYMEKLTTNARIWSPSQTSVTPIENIEPPAAPTMFDDELKNMPMFASIPPCVLENATKMAMQYGKQFENKELRPEDMTLEKITQDLLKSVDQKAILGMAEQFRAAFEAGPGLPRPPSRRGKHF